MVVPSIVICPICGKRIYLRIQNGGYMYEYPIRVYCLNCHALIRQCETARSFLLLADNCGEIVLDKLFIEQLLKRFPHLEVQIMVRGGEVLNDATEEDRF